MKKASLTVEAALIFPIFFYVVVAFLYILQVILIQEEIQSGLTEVARYASQYAYIYEDVLASADDKKDQQPENEINEVTKTIIDGTFFKSKLREFVNVDRIDNSCIVNGFDGISMLKSCFMEDKETIDIIAIYQVDIPLKFFLNSNYTMVSRVNTRGFIGERRHSEEQKEENIDPDSDEQIVYIAENGRVYHLSRECTHLKLSITIVSRDELEELRNKNAGKYKECRLCSSKIRVENVYITNYGDRYHVTLDCPGLKRTIQQVTKSQVKDMPLCSKCSKER